MAVTFTVEDGSSKSDANAYVSVSGADDYHAKHVYATTWDDASQGDKEKALMMATRLLDETFSWNGRKFDDNQALSWPRAGTRDRDGWAVDSDEIPADLKNATAELARLLLDADRTAEDDTRGFKRIKTGSVDIEVDKFDRTGVLTKVVVNMLSPHFGYPRGGATRQLLRA